MVSKTIAVVNLWCVVLFLFSSVNESNSQDLAFLAIVIMHCSKWKPPLLFADVLIHVRDFKGTLNKSLVSADVEVKQFNVFPFKLSNKCVLSGSLGT